MNHYSCRYLSLISRSFLPSIALYLSIFVLINAYSCLFQVFLAITVLHFFINWPHYLPVLPWPRF